MIIAMWVKNISKSKRCLPLCRHDLEPVLQKGIEAKMFYTRLSVRSFEGRVSDVEECSQSYLTKMRGNKIDFASDHFLLGLNDGV